MKLKGAIITCVVVVLYLSLCSWRFEELDKMEGKDNDVLVINAKY
jgi:hypothetical protein